MARIRNPLLLAASTALALGIASASHAQVPEQPGFYAGATGLWEWNRGDRASAGPGLSARPRSGPGFRGVVGQKMDTPWDFALGGGAQWFRNGSANNGTSQFDTSARYQYIDLEAGYSMSMGSDSAIRVFGGIRGLHFNQDATSFGAVGLNAHRNVWGVGPRIGIGAQTFITENIGLVGSVDGSLIAGSFSESGTANGSGYWRLVPVLGGEVGVQYRFSDTPSLAITGGARVDALFNAAFDGGTGRGNSVAVGPFVRLTYNLSGPRGAAPVAPPPAAAPTTGRSYMVFFDFDRAVVTDTAANTIRQAAADAKTGRATRLNVTGHADRSGGDDYNMALSLRRANAVKDSLVREGIAADQIAVVGRGESQPLVQTADGVREPQNRRVEIVF